MAQRVLSGISGSFSITGITAGGRWNRWEATFSTDALDSTGFGATVHQRVAGMQDLQGRGVGYLTEGDAADNPGIPTGTNIPTNAIVSCMASSGSGFTATVIISNVRIITDQNNTQSASRLEFDFMNAGASIQTVWAAT